MFNASLEVSGGCTQNVCVLTRVTQPACVYICVVIDTAVNQHRSFSHVDVIDIIYLAQLLCVSLCVCVQHVGLCVIYGIRVSLFLIGLRLLPR